MTEQDIVNLIKKDEWMMSVLRKAKSLNLPDWVIGAGFVRNKVWDYLHGFNKLQVDTRDIDLIYFDPNGNDEDEDDELSKKVSAETDMIWEIVNIIYSHKWDNIPPHKSVEQVLAHWPETASTVGITIRNSELKLIAPYGIEDLVNLIIRHSPNDEAGVELVKERMEQKQWLIKWPKLKFMDDNI